MINFDRFPENKRKALTMSYDDGKIYDEKLIEIFNRYGIRGTFHINGGLFERPERIDADRAAELYQNHEIAAHGLTHQSLGITPLENMINEIMEDRKALEKITHYPVKGMSYPNGLFNEDVITALKAAGIEYCRVMETTGDFSMPSDFLRWKGTCRNVDSNFMEKAKEFLELPYKNRPRLMYVWGHSIEFENEKKWDMIEEFCDMMSGKDDIWYATNIEILDYVKAVNNLKFTADCSIVLNPSALDVWISIDNEPVVVKGGTLTKLK